jgi:butyrate kinase
MLIINPGSTSTKIGLYRDDVPVKIETLRHSAAELAQFPRLIDQFPFRRDLILNWLANQGVEVTDLDAVVGRGGLLRPIPGGTYQVDEAMLADLAAGIQGEHAANLGAPIAAEIARAAGGRPAFIVDPVVVDELEPVARITGLPELPRRSIFHALNQKAVARRAARDLGVPYDRLNLIMVHLGGGITVGAHKQGRVVDVPNGLDGEGPMSPERAGTVPSVQLVHLAFSWRYTLPELSRMIVGRGGLVAHLGTNDAREVEARIQAGDAKAEEIYRAMAYQVAKEIGRAAAVLAGRVDAVVLTGGLAHSGMLTGWIREQVEWIAPVKVYPGEDELQALAEGALRVLNGEEEARSYAALVSG